MSGGNIARTTLVAIRAKLASGLVATDERITGSVCEPIVCVRSNANRNSLYDDMKASERVGGESTEGHVHESHGERDDRAVLQRCRNLTRLLRDPAAKRSPDIEALRNRTREDVVEVGHRRLLWYQVARACKELVLTLETGVSIQSI